MPTAKCSVCDNEIDLGEKPYANVSVKCPYCSSILLTYRTKRDLVLEIEK